MKFLGLIYALFLTLTVSAGTLSVRDIDGNYFTYPQVGDKGLVIFFANRDCPVANQYVAIVNGLFEKFTKEGVRFLVVYPQSDNLWQTARHVNDFKVQPPAIFDIDQRLTKTYKPKVYAEVVVLGADGEPVYQGRVDDQFTLGARKTKATKFELQDVLESLAQGHAVKTASVEGSACPVTIFESPLSVKRYTYMRDIAPIVKNRCYSCHQPNSAAPFSLANFADVARMAPAMALVLKEFRMPPWFSDSDPELFSHTTQLPTEERAVLLSWIENGRERGSGKEQAWPVEKRTWPLGKPNRVVDLPEVTKVPATGMGYFKEFAVDLGNTTDLWVDKVDFHIDQAKAVHHMAVYTRKKGNEQPEEFLQDRWGYFAAYVPGSGATIFPEGMAKRIPAGHELMINVHYTPIGRELEDRSQIALYFTKSKKPVEVMTDSVHLRDFTIPPHARFYTLSAETTLNEDILLRTVVPHAHFRGRSFLFKATLPDQKEIELLSVPNYRFSWQPAYAFKKPYSLPKGTRLRCEVTYDNSERNPANPDANATVKWGEQSYDEMMFCYYDYLRGVPPVNAHAISAR